MKTSKECAGKFDCQPNDGVDEVVVVDSPSSRRRHRSVQFPDKLWDALESGSNDLLQWSADGKSFIVDCRRFEQRLTTYYPGLIDIPTFANFRRQLREYGFDWVYHVETDDYVFSHPSFLRAFPERRQDVLTRRKNYRKEHNGRTMDLRGKQKQVALQRYLRRFPNVAAADAADQESSSSSFGLTSPSPSCRRKKPVERRPGRRRQSKYSVTFSHAKFSYGADDDSSSDVLMVQPTFMNFSRDSADSDDAHAPPFVVRPTVIRKPMAAQTEPPELVVQTCGVTSSFPSFGVSWSSSKQSKARLSIISEEWYKYCLPWIDNQQDVPAADFNANGTTTTTAAADVDDDVRMHSDDDAVDGETAEVDDPDAEELARQAMELLREVALPRDKLFEALDTRQGVWIRQRISSFDEL